jgi:hypothetical protein
MFNPNVKIYIGDLKYNNDSHKFIEEDELYSLSLNTFDSRVAFIDIDYVGLSTSRISDIVSNSKSKIILTTLYPDKIDKKLECEIIYKDDFIQKNQPKIYEVIKRIFHEKDRKKVWRELQESNVSLFMINKWLQSNANPENIYALKYIDSYLSRISPALWISLVVYLLNSGPKYINYHFKKNA